MLTPEPFRSFFQDIDRRWESAREEKLRLRVIGSAALMLQTDYVRGTKDSDILETTELAAVDKNRLLELAGAGSRVAQRHRMYLEIVSSGLPFLPLSPHWHPLPELNPLLKHLTIEVLDVVDVVVSKLKRFSASDLDDVRAMTEKGLVEHRRLIERFQSAVDVYGGDARADDLPKYVRNLHRVERDHLGVPETEIELPAWVLED
ncbi:MAG: hypothetical protein JNM40_20250 [Myxococcales bacterium]|nr:hypothetical protein [Myxococcales bacterium]